MDVIQTKQKDDVVYVRTRMTAFNRKRLIEQKVPFIVPGNQMYLPTLAIDLRELELSLKDNRDERVEASLEEMMRTFAW